MLNYHTIRTCIKTSTLRQRRENTAILSATNPDKDTCPITPVSPLYANPRAFGEVFKPQNFKKWALGFSCHA